jgi:hypothetical protein
MFGQKPLAFAQNKKPHPRLSPAKKAGQAREEPLFDSLNFLQIFREQKSPFGGFRGLFFPIFAKIFTP